MKITSISFVFLFFLIASFVEATPYISVGGGIAGATNSTSISFDLGYYDFYLLDVGTTAIFNITDKLPDPLHPTPIPYNDYTREGTYQKSNEFGFFAKAGLEILNKSGFYGYLIGGLTYVDQIDIVRANDTGYLYTQYDKTNYYGVYGLGLSYIPNNFYIGGCIEYDNRRGLSANIVVPLNFLIF